MNPLFYSLLVMILLTSCGTAEDRRYRDTSLLERPPRLFTIKPEAAQPAEPNDTDESETSNSQNPKSAESNETVDKETPQKKDKNLKERVYMTDTSPPQLTVKQSFDKTWSVLEQALKLNEIKITDQQRNKGHVYVAYDSSSFFEKVVTYIKDRRKAPVYLLSVASNGDETTISAAMAGPNEQPFASESDSLDKPVDASDELLETLYKTIHDDLVAK